MSVVSTYLNQTAEYAPQIGTDDRGAPLYGEAQQVACRRRCKARRTITSEGETLSEVTEYLLTQRVNTGDTLDGRQVLTVDDWAGFYGNIIGYKAVV